MNGNSNSVLMAIPFLIMMALALVVFIFWVWMFIDCLMRDMPGLDKIIWLLVIFFMSGLGAILYFFLGRTRKAKFSQ